MPHFTYKICPCLPMKWSWTTFATPGIPIILLVFHDARIRLPPELVAAMLLNHMNYDDRLIWFQELRQQIGNKKAASRYIDAIRRIEDILCNVAKNSIHPNHDKSSTN